MARDEQHYSSIRQKPGYIPRGVWTLASFYDAVTSGPTLLAALSVTVGYLSTQELMQLGSDAIDADTIAIVRVALLVFAFAVGARVVQSAILAKRDYMHLPGRLRDILSFFAVFGCLTFLVLRTFDSQDFPSVVLVVYATIAAIGIVNFASLYAYRIAKGDPRIDYVVERRIQLVNTVTCVIIFPVLIACVLFGNASPGSHWWVTGALAACSVLLATNMVHSNELTMAPKFMLENEYDARDRVVDRFREDYSHYLDKQQDAEIGKVLGNAVKKVHRPLRLQRAEPAHANQIAEALVGEFGYVYEYVFGTTDRGRLIRAVRGLLTTAGGFGPAGIMNYYYIINDEDESPVGIVRVDTNHRRTLYAFVEYAINPIKVCFTLRTLRLFAIMRRAGEVRAEQPEATPDTIVLTNLVVFKSCRRRGFALALLILLKHAFLVYHTEYTNLNQMLAGVRSGNAAAESLFTKAGFVPKKRLSEGLRSGLSERFGRMGSYLAKRTDS